ncbi:MAG: patatin-like phospholipase family protein [Bacteroidetes bacterium]|nr:patatin-like phospholipase family protein [Bacteroidota bacterium]
MKIGLSLSGGGARGAMHLGVIQALHEIGIRPEILSGSSAGALVAAFYAEGYSPAEIMRIAGELGIGLFNPFHLSLLGEGLMDMDGFARTIRTHIPHNSFEGLGMPVYVTATDIVRNELLYYHTGPLAPILLATACVPVIFKTQVVDGRYLHDGGILNNLPTEVLRDQCDLLIGSHCNSIDTTITQTSGKNQLIDRAYHMAIDASIQARLRLCDIQIQPAAMTRFGMFDVRRIEEIYRAGYDHTMALRGEIEGRMNG